MRTEAPWVAAIVAAVCVLIGFGSALAEVPEPVTLGANADSEKAGASATVREPPDSFPLLPSPYEILGLSSFRTPPLDLTEFAPTSPVPLALARVLDISREDPGTALAMLRKPADPSAKVTGSELVAAALEARLADDRRGLLSARQQLQSALNERTKSSLRQAVMLELARIDLALGLYPEAAAEARLAVRGATGLQSSLVDAAHLVQAEAAYLSGRPDEAMEIYDHILKSNSPRIAAAAALRQSDIDFDFERPVSDYEERLAVVVALGVDPLPWAPRVSEFALRAGNIESASTWLSRFLEDGAISRAQAVASIRMAELEVWQGERQLGRERLEAIATLHAGSPVGALAIIRLASLGLLEDNGEAISRLRVAAASSHPRVAAYAYAVLGRRLLKDGHLDDSIHTLTRAARSRSNPIKEQTHADLTRALRLSVSTTELENGGCSRLLVRLALRRTRLMEYVSDPDPFLRLGICLEEIGLHRMAIEIYRSLARVVGPAAAGPIALPLARSSLAIGEVNAAYARALAYAPNPEAPVEWRLILARSSLAAGKLEPARKVLLHLVRSNSQEASRPEILALLARTTLQTGAKPDPATLEILDAKLLGLTSESRHDEADAVGDAAMITATMYRRSGDPNRAGALYALASEVLSDGWRRTEAAYWAQRLGVDTKAAGEVFEIAAANSNTTYLARLGRNARVVDQLRNRLQPGGPAIESSESMR